jgi:mono/diheme cytochrome c family protein
MGDAFGQLVRFVGRSFWGIGTVLTLTACLASGAAIAADTLAARGKYVAIAADCMSCHTAPGGTPYAGGDPLKTPFGDIYGPNITQDTATGIGSWTEADFTRALRLGVRKDGALLYPAMPYLEYTKMSDDDLNALWAFMRTIAAVKHRVPDAEKTFHFPFNVRAGLAAWQELYFKPGLWTPTAGKSAAWNRGAYLVDVLGHCGECHTPRNVAEAPEAKYQLTGAQIEGWYAPDISNDPLSKISRYSVGELARFLKTGEMQNNTKSFGPMQETVHDSLRFLHADDLRAIALYLKDQPAVSAPTVARSSASEAELAAGKAVYENNCSSCHQRDGKGIKNEVPALAGNTAVTASEPNDVIMSMLEGFAPQGLWGAMGSFANQLSNEQIADVTNYVRTAWNNAAPANATEWSVGNWRAVATIPASGQQPALICPLVDADVLQPALKEGPDALREAATDHAKLKSVVHDYLAARPHSNPAETIEALSVAYCRAVVSPTLPGALSGAKVAAFSQQIAIILSQTEPPPTASKLQ